MFLKTKIASRTAFQKKVTSVNMPQSIIKYLPTIPEPPEYGVCKDFLLEAMDMLEVPHIFVHVYGACVEFGMENTKMNTQTLFH